jgi:hypothetical protein
MSITGTFFRGFALLSLSGVLVLAQHGGGHGGGGMHGGGAGINGRSSAPLRPTAQGLSGFPASAYSIGIPASAYSLSTRPSTFSAIRPGFPAYNGSFGLNRRSNYGTFRSGSRRGRYGYPLVYGYLAAPYYPFWDYSDDYGGSGYPAYSAGYQGPGPDAGSLPPDASGVGEQIAQLSAQVNDLQNHVAQKPPADSVSGSPAQQAPPAPASPPLTVVLTNGKTLQVQNYAVMGSVLWDLSSQPTRKIPFANIDVPASTKATEASGAEFPRPGV